MRIFKVNSGVPLSQVYSGAINPTSIASTHFAADTIVISNPSLLVYDVVIFAYIPSISPRYYVIYLKFDSDLNTLTIQQTLIKT
jgi:hypothetical protein